MNTVIIINLFFHLLFYWHHTKKMCLTAPHGKRTATMTRPYKRARVGEWHDGWQNLFPGCTEKKIGNRRADIAPNNSNIVVEVQHSNISFDNVQHRNEDYKIV